VKPGLKLAWLSLSLANLWPGANLWLVIGRHRKKKEKGKIKNN